MANISASLANAGGAPPHRRLINITTAFWPLLVSAFAWATLIFMARGGASLELCLNPSASLAKDFLTGLKLQLFQVSPWALVKEWGLMVLAMMLPLAVPHLSIFCARLYRPMQRRAMVAVLSGFVAIWLVIGLFAVPLMLALRALASVQGLAWVVPVLAYGAAILWSLSPTRQKVLRRCHMVPVICGQGYAVYHAAFRFGVRLGVLCGTTCGLAMAAPMLSGQGILAMALITHVLLTERLAHQALMAQTAMPLAFVGLMAAF